MRLKLQEITLFSLLGVIMLISKLIMEFLPNVHLLAMLTVTYTVVYRAKALFPIYIYVFLNGLVSGFGTWWVPYLYIWTVLWGVTMLIPKSLHKRKAIAAVIYAVLCGLHGFLFGVIYSPFQAIVFGLDLKGTIAWIISGLPFDFIHGVSNILASTLVLPVSLALKRASSAMIR